MRRALLLLFSLIVTPLILGFFAASSQASHEITRWRDNHAAAISITFDDGYPSQFTSAVPLLNDRNLKGTFFVITDWSSGQGTSWGQWRQAADQGHEIGSHTVNHSHLTTLSETDLRYQLSESLRLITLNIPEQACVSFAYPYGESNATVRAVTSEYYIVGRGVGYNGLNYYENGPSWSAVDFFNVGSYDAGALNIADTDTYLNLALQRHAWFCLELHNIQNTTSFAQYLDYLLTKDAWIDTFGSIVRYMRERPFSTLTVLSESGTQITLNLTHSLDNSIYNEPLTLRSTVPPSWSKVSVLQGGIVYVVNSIIEGTETAVYYNVLPNNGTITLTPSEVGPTETVSAPSVLSGPTSGIPQITYTYSTGGSYSSLGHSVAYQFDWIGDGVSDLSPWGSATQSKTWTGTGTYNVRARARCATDTGIVSPWTAPITVNITQTGVTLLELNFEEGSGSTALDSSGYGNNGTITGAVYTTASAVGSYALSFDGNDSVSVPSNGSLKPTNISVSLWVKHTVDTTSPNYGGIIQGAYGYGYSNGFRVLDYNNQPLAQMNFGDSGPIWMLGNPFVQNVWCHIVLTYDHAKIKLYQNGALVSEVAENRNINWSTYASKLYIGLAQWYFKGSIDKVKMFNYAISSQEVAQLYAEKGGVSYALTVNLTGSGSVTKNPDKAQYNSGEVVQLTAVPQTGWSFSAWSGDLTGSTNPQSITMSGNKTVTATFTQNQYTLTVNITPSGSGTVIKNPNKATYVYGEQVSLTAAGNTGYSFSSWSGDLTGSTNPQSITMNANKTVTATFSAVAETISTPTVPSGPGSGVTGTSYSYSTGGSTSNLGHAVQYQFDWKGDGTDLSSWGSATQSKTWTAAGSYSVRAWARCVTDTGVTSSWSTSLPVTITQATVSYTVTTSPSNRQITVDGSTLTAPQTFTWAVGSSHTLSVPSPQAGAAGTQYVFASWSDGGAQSHSITVPSSATTLTATLTTQYTLTTAASPTAGGTVTPSGSNWYNSGQVVSVTATANTGYSFSIWSGDLTGSTNPGSVTISAPRSVTATFVPVYTLTVNTVGSGSVTKNPDKAQYNSGEVVQLTAVPQTGWSFSGWSGDLTGSTNPQSITMNANKTVTATFTSTSNVSLLELNFDEGSGTTALDSSGNGNHGTINGATYTTASAVGSYALSFDGNDTVTIQSNASLKPANISIAFWVKHLTDTSINAQGIIQGAYGNGYIAGFRIVDSGNQPLAQMNFGDSGPIRISGNTFVRDAWYHIVVTYDHAKIRLYQNGVLVREVAETRNINWSTSPSNLTIGFAQWYFKGVTDKLKIYNYPLSSQEIAQLYAEKSAVSYNVTTNPPGLQFSVDGVTYTAPQTFNWAVGSTHTLSVVSPQSGTSGTRYVYNSWDDGGTQTHTITAPSSNTTYTASFDTQYSLTTSASLSGGGTVSPSGTSWYNSGQAVSVSTIANSGYNFTGWSGDLSGSTNPTSIAMSGPKSVVANFAPIANTTLLDLNFEEGSGTVALDSSVYGNNGTITGAVYTTPGAVGSYSLSFDGNDSVTVAANTSLKPTDISVALWVKHVADTTSPNFEGIIQGAYGNGYNTGFRVLDYNNTPLVQMNFGSAGPAAILGNPFVLNTWCHIVLTYDHAKLRLYQNGVLVREIAETRNINWSATTSNLTIGLAQWYFKGAVDKITMYNYALNSQEIQNLYNE